MKRVVVVFAMGSLLVASGCSKIREKLFEKAVETSTGGEVDLSSSSGGVTVKDPKTGAAVQTGSAAKLPDGWPSKVPTYPGATIQAAMASPNGKTVVLVTNDSPAQVHAFYKDKLGGMKLQADIDMGAGKVLTYKDGATTVSCTIGANSGSTAGSTSVTLSVAGG